MRIAIYHPSLPEQGRKLGGVELSIHRLANALVEHEGMDVTVFSASTCPKDAYYRCEAFMPGRLRNTLMRVFAAPVFLNFVNFRGFDVLHLHGDDWFFVHRDIPTVRTIHGSALQEARSATSVKRKLFQYLLHPLAFISIRLSTISATVGPETRDLYGLSQIVNLGVDLSLFRRQEKSSTPLLSYIGLWKGRKRGEMAFKTFVEQILPSYPEAKLYMACDHVPDHPSVINGGFPTHAELARWLATSWVFIYPSSYEGFGIPYIEALASGTCVVSTRNGGAEYVLGGGKYGAITSDGEFGPAILGFLGDPEQRQELEQKGLAYVQRFSWKNVAAEHVALYRAAITKSGRRNTGSTLK